MSNAAGRVVLVVGGGGREHALARRLSRSASVAEVLVTPGNAGTDGIGQKIEQAPGGISAENLVRIARYRHREARRNVLDRFRHRAQVAHSVVDDGNVGHTFTECPW